MPFALADFNARKQNLEQTNALKDRLDLYFRSFDRNRQHDTCRRSTNLSNIHKCLTGIAHMLEHLRTNNDIEFAPLKRQRLQCVYLDKVPYTTAG